MTTFVIAFVLVLITFVTLLILIGFFIYIFDAFLELPYVATKKETSEAIISLANIKEGETAIDLGSGDGILLFKTAQKGAFAIGYELNPMLVVITFIRSKLKGLSGKVKVYKSSLWKADLKLADVVFVYARQGTMQKMEDFVYKNVKKGTRIIVNTDLTKPFPSKKPKKIKGSAYLYIA